MAYKFFVVPVFNTEPAAIELNRFLASNRVLCVDRQWMPAGPNSAWHFCVDYLAGHPVTGYQKGGPSQDKIDYKEVLEEKDFQVFSRLRSL